MSIQFQRAVVPNPAVKAASKGLHIGAVGKSSPSVEVPLPTPKPILKRSHSAPLTGTLVSEESIHSKINTVSVAQITQESLNAPKPSSFLKAIERKAIMMNLKRDPATLPKLDKSIQTIATTEPVPPMPAPEPKIRYAQKKFGTSEDVQGLAKLTFSKKLAEMSLLSFNDRKVQQGAQKLATELICDLPTDVVLTIKSRGPECLKLDLAKGLGLANNVAELNGLSKSNKEFLNALVAGFKKGYDDQPGMVVSKFMAKQVETIKKARTPAAIETAVKQMITALPPKGDLNWTLTLRSEDQLKQDVITGLGLSWPLPPATRHLVQNIVNAITASLPNSMSPDRKEIILNGELFRRKGDEAIGKGGFGKVFVYESVGEPKRAVAVKESLDPQKRDGLVKELEIYRHIMNAGPGNPHVTAMEGAIKGPDDSLYVVMELVSGGGYENLSFTQNLALELGILSKTAHGILLQDQIKGMNEGLDYLHTEANLVHHDHKLENVFVDNEGNLKIGDFGGSRRQGLDNTALYLDQTDNNTLRFIDESQFAFTTKYASPRLRLFELGEAFVPDASDDNFTHGANIHRLAGGSLDHYTGHIEGGLDTTIAYMNNPDSKIRPNDPTSFGRLVNDLTKVDTHTRSTTQDVKKSEYFNDLSGYDAEKLADLKKANTALNQVASKELSLITDYMFFVKREMTNSREAYQAEPHRMALKERLEKSTILDTQLNTCVKQLVKGRIEDKELKEMEAELKNWESLPPVLQELKKDQVMAYKSLLALNSDPKFHQAVEHLRQANQAFIRDIR